jgi:perosamine synthetase
MFEDIVQFIQETYRTNGVIPLHEPRFLGNEKKYLNECIDSTFVSSVGKFVDKFEEVVAGYTGAKHAIATVNGTASLHIALKLVGVEPNSEVITQSLTFVATCNAIRYCGAKPVFIDVNRLTLGLSPESLTKFLNNNAEVRGDGFCWNRVTNKKITACMPMHTFGFPVELNSIKKICDKYRIPLVEDAAESLGSFYKNTHTGLIGEMAAVSFNGNKIITTGGGGMILTNNEKLAEYAKHLTTTAKVPHKLKTIHNEIGYNYRLPNLNAALGVAQMELLPKHLKDKRKLAEFYQKWGDEFGIQFFQERAGTRANYWLNTAIMKNKKERDQMLEITNKNNIMARSAWMPMHKLVINKDCQSDSMCNTEWLADRVVNMPSSPNFQV